MAFDINEVLAGMLSSVKTITKDNWNNVKDSANSYLQDRKFRLELLAALLLQKEISQEFFKKMVAEEEKILESELHSIAIVTKAIAQKAANAALDVFQKAVMKVLKL
jgi:hypothetical protein